MSGIWKNKDGIEYRSNQTGLNFKTLAKAMVGTASQVTRVSVRRAMTDLYSPEFEDFQNILPYDTGKLYRSTGMRISTNRKNPGIILYSSAPHSKAVHDIEGRLYHQGTFTNKPIKDQREGKAQLPRGALFMDRWLERNYQGVFEELKSEVKDALSAVKSYPMSMIKDIYGF